METIKISSNAKQYFGMCKEINRSHPMIAEVRVPHLIEVDVDETSLSNDVRLYRYYKGELCRMCEINLLYRDIKNICK